jgi:GTP-binding protein HflX
MTTQPHLTTPAAPTAILVGLITDEQPAPLVKEYLAELAFLAQTAGIACCRQITQRLPRPNIKTYIGSGKIEEVKAYIVDNEISTAIFDDELSPSQTRNLEQLLGVEVLDRTNLILKIFAQRARTAYAKTQVELAQCQYMLPRLKRMWTHLERQRGGTGTRGGSGELQIESDRRLLLQRIALLKEELKKIDRQMTAQRGSRAGMVRMTLVGYTNAGKSTIMNLLAKSHVFAQDKLFATLDTTVRKVVVENMPMLLADTVGFIRKLPTQLVEAFKSTLDELREADILLHVVDISHPSYEQQMEVVTQTLAEIGAGSKPVFVIFNKIDAYTYVAKDPFDLTPRSAVNVSLDEIMAGRVGDGRQPCIFISAAQRTNLAKLRSDLYRMAVEVQAGRYPFESFLW